MSGKKKKRSTKYFLEDIIESVQKVQKYTSSGKSIFFKDEILQDAVIRRLEIIGEASNQLPEKIIERYSEIPWRQIIGLRNVAIHEYFRVDLNLVWSLIESGELENLLSVANRILTDIDNISD